MSALPFEKNAGSKCALLLDNQGQEGYVRLWHLWSYDWTYETMTRTVWLQYFGAKRWTDRANLAVISDPADPKFDLEAYLKVSEAT